MAPAAAKPSSVVIVKPIVSCRSTALSWDLQEQ
jgi:hypothetical protein